MYLVALGLGWKLDRHTEKIEPVVADTLQETEYFTVRPGEVAGIANTASGFCSGRRVIDLDLRMYIGAPDPMDSIEIDGDPPLTFTVAGGVPGDLATVAAVVNAIPRVLESSPGLKTMLDLPIPRAFRAV
jgi:4-hydroxy-tetrahydrodipicolinate reductase